MIRQEPSGWWLPADDTYFPVFAEGPPRRNGFFRHHLLEAFKYVDGWDVAIDVGAHCGWWTFDMAQRFTTVHAFEPVPTTYECLVKNTCEFDNVVRYNVALGDKAGSCEIRNDRQRPGNSGANYIIPTESGEVSVVTLDSFGFSKCNLLKVDVEGFELKVLSGARELIQRCKPVISMECTDAKFPGRYDIPAGQAQRWLLKRGYREMWHERPDKVFSYT